MDSESVKATVAVTGAGPSGLCMHKTLRADGFCVTLYEWRKNVGGLWAYSDNPAYTTALPVTRANLSKFTCGFADFPIPDRICFEASVQLVRRNEADTGWLVTVEKHGRVETAEFDKVALCHGYQTKASIPTFEGQDKFEGTILHSQAYRKKVVVVGLFSTAGDVIPDLMPVASKVYVSHRRGALPFRRYRNGTPNDLGITWRRRQLDQFLTKYLPRPCKWVAGAAIPVLCRRAFDFKLDPAWRLEPFPSITLNLPQFFELVPPYLHDGSLTSLHDLTRFTGPKSLEFADGTVLDDVDAVVLCTGYAADWSIAAPFVENSRPSHATATQRYGGLPLYRLYMNLFPPRYADSCVVVCYHAFGKSNGFSFADGLPSREAMEEHIDAHQQWIAARWAADCSADTSAVKQWEFQQWLHHAAGTGMESLGWGLKGWLFWLKDRRMYNLMNHGVETAHLFSFFETGRRPTWDGALEAVIHQNEVVREMFPVKDIPWSFGDSESTSKL
ncbi:flavin-containing monooxygenase 9 [Podospora appendiculata]|uniref:Flavin-containing monooxygenase 9 n=1 Tax=Podospora appendiculata TaxID=314037 RepID=A0AAE0X0R1_9PEZI|nr:flavin-containing monooxygenase 9 [Podospora appendiculata]